MCFIDQPSLVFDKHASCGYVAPDASAHCLHLLWAATKTTAACSEALEVFKALQEAADALLQFLEASQELHGLSTPLCLAAARALGR